MNIKSFHLRLLSLPLHSPFKTHQASVTTRRVILVEAVDRTGRKGYGEITAFDTPFYTPETIETAWSIIREVLLPAVDWSVIKRPENFYEQIKWVQGHQMAKAGIEGALWDLFAKQKNMSLSQCIGGARSHVKAGAVLSLGDDLAESVPRLKKDGYERFKLKVEKYQEKKLIEAVHHIDPTLSLMIDANGQYDEKDLDYLAGLDVYGLSMIEQPFRAGDVVLHRKLQQQIQTPVCLDESIASFEDAVQAIELEACKIINIKISRVGGLTAALRIVELARKRDIDVWCGGMVETGVSKAHNIALASLEAFAIPGDLSSSTRYLERDIITPEILVENGSIQLPTERGIGFNLDDDFVDHCTVKKDSYRMSV